MFSPSQLIPITQVHLITSTDSKPLLVSVFFDTGATDSLLDPSLLPPTLWKPFSSTICAANGQTFLIDKISKPILTKIFPNLLFQHPFIGSYLTRKDLILGFDLLHKLNNLRWSNEGLTHGHHFLAWSKGYSTNPPIPPITSPFPIYPIDHVSNLPCKIQNIIMPFLQAKLDVHNFHRFL